MSLRIPTTQIVGFAGKVVVAMVGFLLGGWLAFGQIQRIPTLQLPTTHPLFTVMGVHQHKVVGFLPYWLVKKADQDYSRYLTTLTYFGLVVNADGTIQKRMNPQELEPGWHTLSSPALTEKLNQAKRNHLDLSLLVHNMNDKDIHLLISEPEAHALVLVSEVEPIMREYGFTDLNLDIESFRQASDSARQQFTRFVRSVKQELVSRNLGTLTVEMSPSVLVKSHLIDPQEIGAIADNIILMTYDYHYSGSLISGPVAPLGGAGETREFDVSVSIEAAEKAIPKHKLILGLPLYGYEWETINATSAAAIIPGSGRTATHERVTTLLSECPQCITGTDPTSQEQYVVYPDPKDDSSRVIFYGDASLMEKKLKQIELWKGAAVWALGYESGSLLEPLAGYKTQKLLNP